MSEDPGRLDRLARAFYAYDNAGRASFDQADHDERAPYYDLAALAADILDEETRA